MIRDSFVMSGATVKAGAHVTRAIVGEGATIGENVVIDGSEEVAVVGYNEVVGAPDED